MKRFLTALLLTGSVGLYAQTDSIDISTGRDSNGSLISYPYDDDDWEVETPNTSSYIQAHVSTGVQATTGFIYKQYAMDRRATDLNNLCFANLTPTFGFISAYLVTVPDPSGNSQLGDVRDDNIPGGTYTYRRTFDIDIPDCKQIVSAELAAYVLLADDNIQAIYVNGHQLSMNSSNAMYHSAHDANTLIGHTASGGGSYPCIGNDYWSSPMPVEHISINASYLQDGTNEIKIVTTGGTSAGLGGSGLMCDAKIKYTLGANQTTVPQLSFAGTTTVTCVGDPATIAVAITNAQPNASYTLWLYETNSSGTSLVTGTATSNPINLSSSTGIAVMYYVWPSLSSVYTVKVKNNDSGCEKERQLDIAVCGMMPIIRGVFDPSPYWPNLYTLETFSHYDFENTIPGFTCNWTLEELDPVSWEPYYLINAPSCWPANHNKFEGFDANLIAEYKDVAVVNDLPCTATDGLFEEDHVYRITRYVKTDNMQQQSYSLVVTPKGFGKTGTKTAIEPLEGNTGTGTISVYPNPASGRFMITTTGNAGTVAIYDALGKKVKELNIQTGHTNYEVDLSGMPAGIYTVSITSGTRSTTQKLMLK